MTKGVQAFIADKQYRQRDERYRDQARHQSKSDPLWDKGAKPKKVTLFRNTDFELAGDDSHCVCPAGQRLYRNGVNCNIGGYRAMKFTGTLSGCGASRYAGARRWTASGSCIAWFTTSINSRTRGIGDERDISTDARQAPCQNGCPLAPTGRMPNMRSSRLRQIETGNRRRHMMNTIADRISLIRQPL